MESLTIRKLSPATTKAYQADLAAVTRRLPPHDGPWMVDELVGPVLRTAFAALPEDGGCTGSIVTTFNLEGPALVQRPSFGKACRGRVRRCRT